MLKLINGKKISRTLLQTLTWVASNIFRFKNLPDELVIQSIPIPMQGLFVDDVDILSNSLWTLSYMADTNNDNVIGEIATDACILRVITAMGEKDFAIFVPALRAIGNILTTNNHEIINKCLWQ